MAANGLFSWIPLIGRYFVQEEHPVPEVLPPAKVAIIGGGVGGCSAAYFLNRDGGKNLDIHLFNEGDIGGRCAVIEFDGNTYEAGGAVIHTSNKYLVDFKNEFGLAEYSGKKEINTPLALYDGQGFPFQLGWSGIFNTLKLLWNYGLSVIKMSRFVKHETNSFKKIYDIQASGRSFDTVPELLRAMGGDEFYQQTQVTGADYMTTGELHWDDKMVNELVCAAMKTNYGQDNGVDAFTAFVSLAGMEDGSLWSVIGGNYQIPKGALEASGATLHTGTVSSVTKVDNGDSTSYTLEYTKPGDVAIVTATGFDLVIIAHPLNLSTVRFNGFENPVYTPAAKTSYHRTVATFVKGELNGETFGLSPGEQYPRSFPLAVLGIELRDPPVDFNTASVIIPTTVTVQEANESYFKPLRDEPTRVWKVFSNHILSEADMSKLFRRIDSVSVKDWLAYPQYNPPEEFPPFILDGKGLLYINCIEKAASAMEMSAIGAKNVALLAKKYILAKKKED